MWSSGVSWLGKQLLCICLVVVLVDCTEKTENKDKEEGRLLGIGSLLNSLAGYNYNNNNGYNGYNGFNGFNYYNNHYNNYNYDNCPLCDSSVLSYCSDPLLHDACCCLPASELPRVCRTADCTFLHANSCREHALITRCCCAGKRA